MIIKCRDLAVLLLELGIFSILHTGLTLLLKLALAAASHLPA